MGQTILNRMTERAEKARLIEAVQSVPNERQELAFIRTHSLRMPERT